MRRFRNRLRGLRDRWHAGTVTGREVEQRVRAWVAHGAHADTWRLRRAIFPGRVVRAARPAGPRGPVRPPAAVCCAAVRGTTTRRTSVPARARSRAGNRERQQRFSGCRAPPRRRSRCGHDRGGRARERPGSVMMTRRRPGRARRRHVRRPSWFVFDGHPVVIVRIDDDGGTRAALRRRKSCEAGTLPDWSGRGSPPGSLLRPPPVNTFFSGSQEEQP